MSRHWRPERSDWTVIDGYACGAPKVRGRGALLVLGAMFVGVIAWSVWQSWPARPVESGLSSEIEWNAVQGVPTRTPDAQDIEWQKRAQEPLAPPVIASPEGARQSSLDRHVAYAPRDDGQSSVARNDITVIDGDTFSFGGQRIRIAGMDAPEIHPPRCVQEAQLGSAATQKLKELLSSGTVTISGSGRDKYGRELRQVSVNGVDVAQAMIAGGAGEVDRPGLGEDGQEQPLPLGGPAGEPVAAGGKSDSVEGHGIDRRFAFGGHGRQQVGRPGVVLLRRRHQRQARPARFVCGLGDGPELLLRLAPGIEIVDRHFVQPRRHEPLPCNVSRRV